LNGTYHLLVYADNVNILGGSICTIKKNTKAVVVAGKETGLEVNGDMINYMNMTQDKDAERTHMIKTDNSSFERVEEF